MGPLVLVCIALNQDHMLEVLLELTPSSAAAIDIMKASVACNDMRAVAYFRALPTCAFGHNCRTWNACKRVPNDELSAMHRFVCLSCRTAYELTRKLPSIPKHCF